MARVRLLTVVETPEFLRRAAIIGMDEADRAALVQQVAADPEAGVSLGGGLRKLRFARKGEGKSGGFRVLHFIAPTTCRCSCCRRSPRTSARILRRRRKGP